MSSLPARQRVLHLVGVEAVELRTVALPRPGPGELLVRVDVATTCGTDLKVWRRGGHPRMLQPPCPFGHELTGTVVLAGDGVRRWRQGDRVVVANSASCGDCAACAAGRENLCRELIYLNGAFAEYLLVPARFVARSTYAVPAGVAPELAALAEPLACVLHGVAAAPVPTGEAVVVGVGPIGLLFVGELTRVGWRVVAGDLTPARLTVAATLGAAATVVLDGTDQDAAALRAATTGGNGPMLVVEATGVPAVWSTAVEVVAVGGTVVLFGGCPAGTVVPLDTHRLHYDELTVKGVYHHRPETMATALERFAAPGPDYRVLLEERCGLEGVENALRRMDAREILKAAVLPHGL